MKTITTVEELGALPEGAVIRDRYQTLGELAGDGWKFPCGKDIKPSRVALPATLLHPLVFDLDDLERAAEAIEAALRADFSDCKHPVAKRAAIAALEAIESVQ